MLQLKDEVWQMVVHVVQKFLMFTSKQLGEF